MSQSTTLPAFLKHPTAGQPTVAQSPEFLKLRPVFESLIALLPPTAVVSMLDDLLEEQVRKEITRLTTQPDWLRTQLELRGDLLTVQLLKSNWEHLGGSSLVCDQFKIPRSTLHREKDSGRVIAFRPSKDSDFVFPLEQFEPGGIQAWPAAVVQAVGNGAPALQFLYGPRKQLENQSFAEALRAPRDRDVPALIRQTIARLTAE